jgi:hypothetical protein
MYCTFSRHFVADFLATRTHTTVISPASGALSGARVQSDQAAFNHPVLVLLWPTSSGFDEFDDRCHIGPKNRKD